MRKEKTMIPQNWSLKKLGEIVDFYDNKRKPIKENERNEGIYPYYGASGIIGYINDYIFDGKYILLGEDGENIISRNLPLVYLVNGKFWVNNHAHVLKSNDNVISEYLVNFLNSIDYKKYNTGTAQPKINKAVCEKIYILLPPLQEQKAIAEILTTWDTAIEKQEELIKLKQKQFKGLKNNLLSGKILLKEFKRSKKYIKSKFGLIPNDWKITKLKKVCHEIVDGTHTTPQYVEKGVQFYSVENVTNNNFSNTKYISEKEHQILSVRCKVEKNNILLTRIGTLGIAKLIDWDVNASIYVSLALLKLDEKKIDPQFLVQVLNSNYFNKELKQKSLLSAIPQKINLNEIEKLDLIVPNLIEQKAITQILSTADKEIELLEKELEHLKEQKKGLMQNLLTGKVRVK